MTEPIKLIILGEPKVQQRHRSAIMPRKGTGVRLRDGQLYYRKKDLYIHNYDESAQDKAYIVRMTEHLAPSELFDCPLRVDVHLYYAHTKGHYGTGRNAGTLKASAPKWKSTKPDRDNADKIILDALEDTFWANDARICAGEIFKQYSENPRTEIIISTLDEETTQGLFEKE